MSNWQTVELPIPDNVREELVNRHQRYHPGEELSEKQLAEKYARKLNRHGLFCATAIQDDDKWKVLLQVTEDE